MKLKKVVSICLVGALTATMLAACSDSSDEVTEEEVEEVIEEIEEEIEEATAEEEEEIVEEEDAETEEEEASEDSGYSFQGFDETISIKGYGIGIVSDGMDEIVDAINEISIPAINVELDYTQIDIGSYSEQIGLMFAGGEAFDFMYAASAISPTIGFSEMYANNELMDISPYVYEYAPETMELLGDYADSFWIDGGLYGLPTYDIYNSDCYIIMRQDILDYLGLTEQAENMSSWSDFEDILETVYDAQDELPEELQTTAMINAAQSPAMVIPYHGFDNAADDFSEHYGFDFLGDSNYLIKVDDGTVTCWYETQDYQDIINRVRDWYEKGWVYKDAATDIEDVYTEMSSGVVFCAIDHSEVGVESAKKQSTGYDVVCVNCCPRPILTNDIITGAYVVPVTATEPEAAVAFLNLMYTNADIENLFVYGIEGRDYELNEEGEAVLLADGLYSSGDFMYGNQFLAYPSEGEGSDFREYSEEIMMDEELSPYYGFVVNLEPVENEVSAIDAVVQQYAPSLNTGTLDPADTYDEFIDSLYAAGMQTLLDYYQEQLDEWMAAQ